MFGDAINLRRLRLFVELAKIGNIGRAAAHLKIEQASLSRSLADLERDVGHRLFDRQPLGMALTAAGSRLEDFAASVLAQIDGFKIQLGTDEFTENALEGVLRVGLSASLAPILLPSFATQLLRKSTLFVEDDDSTLCDATARGELDLCVTCGVSRSSDIVTQVIFKQPVAYIIPAKWIEQNIEDKQTLREVLGRPLIINGAKSGIGRMMAKEAYRFNIPMSNVIEIGSLATTKAMIAAGVGASASIRKIYDNEALVGRVRIAEITNPRTSISICISHRKHEMGPLIQRMLAELSAALYRAFQ